MKVLINTGFLATNHTQQSRYFLYEIFKRITAQNPQVDFYFLVTPENENDFLFGGNSFTIKINRPQQTGWYKKYWISVKLPLLLRAVKPQLMVQPVEYFNPAIKIPQVVMVCEETRLPKKINRARQMITTTENLKKEIVQKNKLEEEKVNSVYAAPGNIFQPVNEIIKLKTKDEFSRGHEYFLWIDETGKQPTLISVLKAFTIFKNKQQSNMKLLILGDNLLYDKNIAEKIRTYKYRDDVILLEDVKEQDIAEIIATAYAVIYQPIQSGGPGLPMMWAMQCGVPVISSNKPGLAEIGGAAALYAHPLNHEDIAQQILLLYKDENERGNLIKNSKQQVLKFNWENSAGRFWQQMLKATT